MSYFTVVRIQCYVVAYRTVYYLLHYHEGENENPAHCVLHLEASTLCIHINREQGLIILP
jgi:hypothetical protein